MLLMQHNKFHWKRLSFGHTFCRISSNASGQMDTASHVTHDQSRNCLPHMEMHLNGFLDRLRFNSTSQPSLEMPPITCTHMNLHLTVDLHVFAFRELGMYQFADIFL